MSSLGFGLNIPKSRKPPPGPPTRKPLARKPPPGFAGAGGGDHDSDSDDAPSGGIFGTKPPSKKPLKSSKPSKPTAHPPSPPKLKKDISRHTVNAQLATFNALSAKASTAAETTDPAIYDYDSVYDDMKSVLRVKQAASEAEAAERKPKYMESLLQAAEVRKRDQLRAREKMLMREREAEGEEFKDKEKFVTEAYKAQQEEVRRLEEEERVREGRRHTNPSIITRAVC